MDLEKLDEPFAAEDIEWRAQSCGVYGERPWVSVLAYVTNRAIMKRLDDVCGKAGWRNEYTDAPNGGLLCGISIKCGDEWITKWDGADNTNMEAVKGGLSGAMKRAAVQWGIGRYLYSLESNYAQCQLQKANGWKKAQTKDKKHTIYWQPPQLPQWALPKQAAQLKSQQDTKPPATSQEMLNSFTALIGSCTTTQACEQAKTKFFNANGGSCMNQEDLGKAQAVFKTHYEDLEQKGN